MFQRNPGMDLRPVSGFSPEAKGAVEGIESLSHADEPQPISLSSTFLHSIKSAPIVADTESHTISRAEEPDQHLGRIGMFAHILEAFLQDAKEAEGLLVGKLDEKSSHLHLCLHTSPPLELLHMFVQGCFQTEMREHRGVQLVRELLQVGGQPLHGPGVLCDRRLGFFRWRRR